MTSTAPFGDAASATTPINSPFGPLRRISSPAAAAAPGRVVLGPTAEPGAGVAEALVDDASSSSPQPASSAAAAALVSPISPNRRSASRRVSRPSAQSSTVSSMM
jgi:hypothetical protein